MATMPPTYQTRRPTPDDADALLALINAHDMLMTGTHDVVMSDIIDTFRHIDLENNAWVVLDGERLIGYEELHTRPQGRVVIDGYVHPDYVGQGIGGYLVGLAEARANELIPTFPPDIEVFITAGQYVQDENASAMFMERGFSIVRHYFDMQIEQDGPPTPVVWPEGYQLHPFDPDRDSQTMYELHMAAFADHYGFARSAYETWRTYTIDSHGARPDLWFYVAQDGEPAALCINTVREANGGWVMALGVVPRHRRRGLGMAILQHSFGLFYAAGIRTVGLGVDATNPHGAVQLYEKAGMHVTKQFASQEKVLRAGVRQTVT